MYTVQVVEVTLMPGDTTYIAKVLKYWKCRFLIWVQLK
jgi:hypothetical protein